TGPITNLKHQTEAQISDLKLPALKPVNARFSSSGQQFSFEKISLELAAGPSVLSLNSQANLTELNKPRVNAKLQDFKLVRENDKIFSLQQPVAISLTASSTNSGQNNWSAEISNFVWQGADQLIALSAQVAWPERGVASVTLTNITLTNFSDFIEAPIPKV